MRLANRLSGLYPTASMGALAETIARITPGRLQKSIFTASGTEADETAVTLAQVYTGAMEVIALRHGYSGRSMLAQALTAHAPWRATGQRPARPCNAGSTPMPRATNFTACRNRSYQR